MSKRTLNDTDRAQWIDNDEGIYNWWRQSGQSKRAFVKQHRAEIDNVINKVCSSEKPAHYLTYGG